MPASAIRKVKKSALRGSFNPPLPFAKNLGVTLSLEAACKTVIGDKLKKIGGEGGLIAVDALGNIILEFNSEGMYRGFKNSRGETSTDIYKD